LKNGRNKYISLFLIIKAAAIGYHKIITIEEVNLKDLIEDKGVIAVDLSRSPVISIEKV
jgi:uncharacterized membrane protein